MARAIEFHHSQFSLSRREGGDLHVRLSAYVHESEGKPGIDAGTGSTQDVDVIVHNAKVEGTLKEGSLLGDGRLQFDDELFEAIVPLPYERKGRANLTLMSGSDELVVTGESVRLSPVGEPRLVEKFPFGPGKRP